MSATDRGDKINPQVTVKNIYRLNSQQYQELETKALSGVRFRDDTGPVQAGFLAGVEHVLRLVRNGFTIQ